MLSLPKGYKSHLNIRDTEIAVKLIKDYFEKCFAKKLKLSRVSAPLFVKAKSGLNDNLSGVERPIIFETKDGNSCEVVHSLAKWKRLALKKYEYCIDEGIYADINAIRCDEDTDNLHSIYVDQWDWERIILNSNRNLKYLKLVVSEIYKTIKRTETFIVGVYSHLKPFLPSHITFISAQELENTYPTMTSKERESIVAKKYGAVFLIGIGNKMTSGNIHESRAPDYDDWSLNGDIIIHYPLLNISMEISSMGIRVDSSTLIKQLEENDCIYRAKLPFQQSLLKGELPQTIGGGIGQSRLCMLLLQKAHIGEVQSSIWPDEMLNKCHLANIHLL